MSTVLALRVASSGNYCEARCSAGDDNSVTVEYYLDDELFRVAEHPRDTRLIDIFDHINKTIDSML